jgi:hypothetical protein
MKLALLLQQWDKPLVLVDKNLCKMKRPLSPKSQLSTAHQQVGSFTFTATTYRWQVLTSTLD